MYHVVFAVSTCKFLFQIKLEQRDLFAVMLPIFPNKKLYSLVRLCQTNFRSCTLSEAIHATFADEFVLLAQTTSFYCDWDLRRRIEYTTGVLDPEKIERRKGKNALRGEIQKLHRLIFQTTNLNLSSLSLVIIQTCFSHVVIWFS